MSNLSLEILSQITHFTKYGLYNPLLKRRETWFETCYRNRDMHIKKYPFLREEIIEIYERFVITKKVLPSMRSMQFAGKPIELANNRLYNCCYLPIDHWKCFSEIMFLLLGGSGVGYSVQRQHVAKLPSIRRPMRTKRFLISDDIIGWSEAVKALTRAYLDGKYLPQFDFSDIRTKGAKLKTSGGKAPGPEPLKNCLRKMQDLFDTKENGTRLSPLEVHDLICFVSDAVLAGGIRRAALICGFNIDEEEMIRSKGNFSVNLLEKFPMPGGQSWQARVETKWNGKIHNLFLNQELVTQLQDTQSLPWWLFEPQRGRANNSAIFLRYKATKRDFNKFWKKVVETKSGDPGIYFSNNSEWFSNPCNEIALRPYQFCNLTEINANTISSQEDLNERAEAAAFIGTIQAGYTNFHYLRNIWKETTERDALLGISMTGITGIDYKQYNFEHAVELAVKENERVAKWMDIRPAARITCIKPSGTSSLILGTSSGCHAWYDQFYIRRMKVNKQENIYKYLRTKIPYLIEEDIANPDQDAFITIPIAAPEGAILSKNETAIEFLERVAFLKENWINPGHLRGDNTHNVSATAYVKDDEWDQVGEWMWENKEKYNGLTVLPFGGGTHIQAPHESITKEKYEEMIKYLNEINLTEVKEDEDKTTRKEELACSGQSCEVS